MQISWKGHSIQIPTRPNPLKNMCGSKEKSRNMRLHGDKPCFYRKYENIHIKQKYRPRNPQDERPQAYKSPHLCVGYKFYPTRVCVCLVQRWKLSPNMLTTIHTTKHTQHTAAFLTLQQTVVLVQSSHFSAPYCCRRQSFFCCCFYSGASWYVYLWLLCVYVFTGQ